MSNWYSHIFLLDPTIWMQGYFNGVWKRNDSCSYDYYQTHMKQTSDLSPNMRQGEKMRVWMHIWMHLQKDHIQLGVTLNTSIRKAASQSVWSVGWFWESIYRRRLISALLIYLLKSWWFILKLTSFQLIDRSVCLIRTLSLFSLCETSKCYLLINDLLLLGLLGRRKREDCPFTQEVFLLQNVPQNFEIYIYNI